MNSVQSLVAMRANVGGQLDDNDIVGRDAVVAMMLDYLERGMNLTINDPRRIGKSAVLQLLEARSTKRVTIVKTSVQKVHSLDHFLMHLLSVLYEHQSLRKRARNKLGDFVDTAGLGIELGGVEYAISRKPRHVHKNALTLLDEVVAAINDSLDDDELLVLALDEFTEAVINIASQANAGRTEATQMLQALQTLRKDQTRVRWILTGSIGMHHAIRHTDCTSVVISGDCQNIPVGPLSRPFAEHLSRCLALGEKIELTNDAHAHLAASVDGIPILVHAVIDDLRKLPQDLPFGYDDVDAAINRYISDNDESRAFEHFVSRLQTYYYGEELDIARALLDRASSRTKPYKTDSILGYVGEQLQVRDEAVRAVRTMLIDDHYLIQDNDRLWWRYPILARIWKAKR